MLGNYALYSLSAGTFVIREAVPAGTVITKPATGLYTVGVALGQNVTGRDFGNRAGPIPPTVSIVATDSGAAEPPSINTGLYTISRTGSTTAALTVNFTISGTAANGTVCTGVATVVGPATSSTLALASENGVVGGACPAPLPLGLRIDVQRL